MPDLIANPTDLRCNLLFCRPGIEVYQRLDPVLSPSRARDARGRFAAGHSGNPRGRPPGMPNPRRRVPDLRLRPLSPAALSALIDRKPQLLRPLLGQVLPRRAPIGPAERLGINLLSLQTADDLRKMVGRLWAAVARGQIAPGEAARIARRGRARLRAARRLQRRRHSARLMAYKTAPALPPIDTPTSSSVAAGQPSG